MGIGKGSSGPDVSGIGQPDIRMPAIELVKLFPDSIGRPLLFAVPANSPLFLTAYQHQIRVIYIREEFVVSIDLFTDLSILISLIL